MLQEFTIEWCEFKDIKKLNKRVLMASLKDTSGHVENDVTLWPDNWMIDELRPGTNVKGRLDIKKNGNFTNKTLYPETTDTRTKPSAPSWAKAKDNNIKKAMDTKRQTIEEAQDRKADAIKIAACARDATLLTVAYMNSYTQHAAEIIDPEQMKKMWLEWRSWLMDNFGDEVPF